MHSSRNYRQNEKWKLSQSCIPRRSGSTQKANIDLSHNLGWAGRCHSPGYLDRGNFFLPFSRAFHLSSLFSLRHPRDLKRTTSRRRTLYRLTYFDLFSESARLARPWHLRGSHFDTASVHYLRNGPTFFGFLLGLLLFMFLLVLSVVS